MTMMSASSMIPGTGPHPPPPHVILKNGQLQGHSQAHALNDKSMDGRIRMDSPKFLVPSLPPSSARHEAMSSAQKRKDRSHSNGTVLSERDNGRSRYDHAIPLPTQQNSPRQRESLSPMYGDMIHPFLNHVHQMPLNPANYPTRLSVPIPSSSPLPASSASPKPPSPSSKSSSNCRGPPFSPQLPGGHGELSPSSRLYPHQPNGYGHPNLGMPNPSAAFFAAAAAAAAGSPYSIFGSPYAQHAHAASSYLDSFHSNILAQKQQQQQMKVRGTGNPAPMSVPSSSISYLPNHLRIPYHPHGTSTTSLHTKLIESASERYSGHGHVHGHAPGISTNRNGDYAMSGAISNGMSNAEPLGMNPLDPPLAHITPSSLKKSSLNGGKEGTKSSVPINSKYSSRSPWTDRDYSAHHRVQYSKTSPNGPNLYERHNPFPSPAHMNSRESMGKPQISYSRTDLSENPVPVKICRTKNPPNIFAFPPEKPSGHPSRIGKIGNNFPNRNPETEFPLGKEGEDPNQYGLNLNVKSSRMNSSPFHPPDSPKKRKTAGSAHIQWNYGVSSSVSPSSHPLSQQEDSIKYLTQKSMNKPCSVPSSPSYFKSAQAPLSKLKVPQSPTVTFKLSPKVSQSPKKVLQASNENQLNNRSLLLSPLPIEEMPVLEAFRQGSLIQLANGEVKSVENLCGEDFTHSAAQMTEGVRIVYCKVLAIQQIPSTTTTPTLCKLTLGMESHKQQVILTTTLEQPFFVIGRGWSSLNPEVSRRSLQLPCQSLLVGDICMTLTRTLGICQPTKAVCTVAGAQKTGNDSSTLLPTTKPKAETPWKSTLTIAGINPKHKEDKLPEGSGWLEPNSSKNTVSELTISITSSEVNEITPKTPPATSSSCPIHLKKRRWSAPEPEVSQDVENPENIGSEGISESKTSTLLPPTLPSSTST